MEDVRLHDGNERAIQDLTAFSRLSGGRIGGICFSDKLMILVRINK
jgi:hypothetical protein